MPSLTISLSQELPKPNIPTVKNFIQLLETSILMIKIDKTNSLNMLILSKLNCVLTNIYSLTDAANHGVYSAYFYLGMMNMEGMYPIK